MKASQKQQILHELAVAGAFDAPGELRRPHTRRDDGLVSAAERIMELLESEETPDRQRDALRDRLDKIQADLESRWRESRRNR